MEKIKEQFFFSWPEAFQAGVENVGGKGWNLGRLSRYGFTVPGGGVLSAAAYKEFMHDNGLRETVETIMDQVTIDSIGEKDTEERLELLREEIKEGAIPPHIIEEVVSNLDRFGLLHKPLAVRSSASAEDSAGASFAGIHESFLNVCGLDNVLAAVKECYASLWTPRAVSYRRKMKVRDNEVIPAVVIMEMVEAKAAGIGFTCDPRTGRWDELVINANYGLGESVVGGLVEPDEYHLEPGPVLPEIRERRIGRKEGITVPGENGGTEFRRAGDPGYVSGDYGKQAGQVLSDEYIVKLGLLIMRVFDALGEGQLHQDIEWVFDGEEFVLVQARPVTALPSYTYPALKGQPEIWSNANIRDALPMVQSTLSWSTVRVLIDIMLTAPLKAVGYTVLPGLPYTRLYQGRGYFNLSVLQWEYYDAFGVSPRETNDVMGGHQPEIEIPEREQQGGLARWRKVWRKLRLVFALVQARKKAKQKFIENRNFAAQYLKKDYKNLGDREIADVLEKFNKVLTAFVPTVSLLNNSCGAPLVMLAAALEKDFPGRGNAIANALLTGRGEITSAEHGYRLVEMAEMARKDAYARPFFSSRSFEPLLWETGIPESSTFKHAFRAFLEEFGHRGVYEGDTINPRWREDPSYLLNLVRSMIETADLSKIKAQQKERGKKVWQEIDKKVPFHRRRLIKWWVAQGVKGTELREMGKSELVRFVEPSRLISREIGRRLEERGILERQLDVFHCSWPELASILTGYWDGRGLKTIVYDRKEKRKELEALSPPDVIIDEAPQYSASVTAASGEALMGLGVAAGKTSGKARLIYHPDEGGRMEHGEVLVAPSTDPGWTPLFLKASAVVMETGGYLSHGAIVAREYGVPAVVNIPGVLNILKEGQEIIVDGDEGKIYLRSGKIASME